MSDQVFTLPDLGEGLTEAEVVRWLVTEGETVTVDQPVVEVETAKSLVEVPSPYAGKVAARHAPEGSVLEVGKPLLTVSRAESVGAVSAVEPAGETYREEERAGSGNVLIGYGTPGTTAAPTRRRRPRAAATPSPSPTTAPPPASAALPPSAVTAPSPSPTTVPPTPSPEVPASPPSPHSTEPSPATPVTRESTPPTEPSPAIGRRVRRVVSPLVRRLARDTGVDLGSISGSGAGGLIVRADVLRALSAQARDTGVAGAAVMGTAAGTGVTAGVAGRVRADTGVTGVPGERRVPLSGFRKAVSAALTRSRAEIPEATVWVDVDATRLWELREATRPGPGILAYLARFTVAALREYPVLNSRVDTERQEIVELERIDLGLAVQGNRGLVVPAVTDAGALTTAGLDKEIRRVTESARQGTVLGSGTFTLNNYGGFRVDGSAAIINHPQVAILGFGRILDRPWVVDGAIRVRKITQMSFVFDHRVCDGGTAAGFMRSVADAIEDPASAIARL
ncbi:hypothetical protein Aab01nite_78260 [Paractinoplanes abujensis]|uniref:Dihydrolipoamide acetyltransferase component of pyruvate dehydrogenase complex n=1 Tax=Paractinoplanes abujensis TaxID=882441 RepID=A0A7W7CQ07_9ACTN|nr:dihydrolipoamide acetyltransferase family protein [Actinoplanes abujensis]MBB4692284.1 pyruvate dehydrogenase E2 component (dihydrolipoamide acetyltransferase) [Actinoplanes abujensis]GID24236.1 hypothetical protein Aab01nite_78260 [Actinoplanes abujensis]